MLDPNMQDTSSDVDKRNGSSDIENTTETVDLYDANEGLVKRDGGPYLDVLEREQAEIRRAKIENREPDLDNPPPVAGTQLVTKAKLVETDASRFGRFPENTESNVEPVTSYEADLSSTADLPADPRQKDWDNDTQTFRGDWDNDTQTDLGRPAEPVDAEPKTIVVDEDGSVTEENADGDLENADVLDNDDEENK